MTKQYDVIIVGGGPAGLATGIHFARADLSVLICEAKSFPVEKACGEGIMPTGVRLLENLGMGGLAAGEDYYPFSGVRYIGKDGVTATGTFNEGSGWGMHRRTLSEKLFLLAASFPQITVREKTRIQSIQENQQSVIARSDREEFETCLLIGADGLHSLVRSQSALDQKQKPRFFRWGISKHFQIAPWSDWVEVYWSNGIEAYVTPLSSKEIGLAILWNQSCFHTHKNRNDLYASLLCKFPELAKRLGHIPSTGPILSAGSFLQRSTHAAKDRILLVGDAAGYVDAITGEGISLALAEAELACQYGKDLIAYPHENKRILARYERALKQRGQNSQKMTYFALFLSQHPRLAGLMIQFLSKQTRLFQYLLSVNMGTADFSSR